MKAWLEKYSNFLIIVTIYVIIILQYPVGVGIFQLLLHKNVQAAMDPTYLLTWGFVRLGLVLPLIFFLMQRLSWDMNDIFLRLGDYKKVIAITFWSTFAFMLAGTALYPWFLRMTTLTPLILVEYMPMFIVYALSNAFVEETFFRGVLQNALSKKVTIPLAILVQSLLFAAIHFFSPMNNNLLPFVLLTLLLGLLWGYLTNKYHSLLPAIVLHVVADIFVAVSLF